MARRLSEDLNTLRIFDRVSGTEIHFHYRMPSTRERAAYTNGMIQRRGRRVISQAAEMRLKYGAEILCGIREGDFEVRRDDRFAPIASDPGSAHFADDWKAQVVAHAPDLVEQLGAFVFEGSSYVQVDEADEPEAGGGDAEGD